MVILKVIGVVLLADLVLLAFGLFCLYFGRKMKNNGKSILDKGIMPKHGGLFGNPETDIHGIPKLMGYGQLYGSFFYLMFAWLALIAIPVFTVAFPLSIFWARNM